MPESDNVADDALVTRIQALMVSAELSRASMSKVLGVSSMSLRRWFEGAHMSHWVHGAVERRVSTLEAYQQEHNLLKQLHGLQQREKVDRLIGVLYNSFDWG